MGAVAVVLMLLTNLSVRAQEAPPKEPTDAQAEVTPAAVEQAAPTIADLVADSEDFTILAKALQATGLADTLAAEGSYTVFAPTNAAFEQLPEGKLEALMKPENSAELRAILLNHISEGEVSTSQMGEMEQFETLQGEDVPVSVDGASVSVGDGSIVKPDVAASNGVVHVVDVVIVPRKELSEEM